MRCCDHSPELLIVQEMRSLAGLVPAADLQAEHKLAVPVSKFLLRKGQRVTFAPDLQAENKRLEMRVSRARLDVQKVAGAYNALSQGLARRQDKIRIMDKTVERMACSRFNALMWKKGHMGHLKLRRAERKLEIKVTIKGDTAGGVEKDLKSLSGEIRRERTMSFAAKPRICNAFMC